MGLETSDDAAVYKITDEIAMIQTVDFFTPVVDDPYMFGQIAAANSLSDVYAMGGEPKIALNIAAFPSCLDPEILGDILRGGADKVKEAGAVLVGGHTIQDNEPKYGLSVSGFVHPKKVWKNYGCQTGDILILTKPIGSGIVNTAVKAGMASETAIMAVIKVMASLNKTAKEVIQKYPISACTDVTGFGLLGHCAEMASASEVTLELEPKKVAWKTAKEVIQKYPISACTDVTGFGLLGHCAEMASASEVTLELEPKKVAWIEEADSYAKMGLVPAGAYRNREHSGEMVDVGNAEEYEIDLLYDPQTSGGLLFSIAPEYVDGILRDFVASGIETEVSVIGRVTKAGEKWIRLV